MLLIKALSAIVKGSLSKLKGSPMILGASKVLGVNMVPLRHSPGIKDISLASGADAPIILPHALMTSAIPNKNANLFITHLLFLTKK